MTASHRFRSFLQNFFIVVCAVTTITCGGDSGTTPEDEPPQTKTLSISLEASQATSGGRIKVNGIPGNVSNVYAVVTVPSTASAPGGQSASAQTSRGIAIIERGADDELIVPLHPDAPMEGGDVNVRVTNGSNVTSNTVTMRIDPLPAAPGEFDALVGDLQTLVDTWLDATGMTRTDLDETPAEELSTFELPLLFVYYLIDSPDNPNSLRALADGDIPLFDDGEDLDRDVLDAIVARTELRAMVAEKIVFLGGVAPPDLPAPVVKAARVSRTATRTQECINPPDFDIGEDDCALLSEIMAYQSTLELEAQSALEKYKQGIRDAVLTLFSYGRAAKIAGGVASSFWAAETVEEGHLQLYPSQFISDETDFEVDTETFPEDFTSKGHWDNFRVSAVSNGWNFEKRLVQAFEQMYGAAQGLDVPEGVPTEPDFYDKYDGMVKSDLTKNAKEKILNDPSRELEYCAQMWHGIKCTGLPYSTGSSPSLMTDDNEKSYEPTETGSTTLLVETLPVFGLGRSTGETKVITTEELQVFIDPFQATRAVEEVQEFTVRIEGAENKEVAWSVEWPANNEGFLIEHEEGADVGTPSNPWQTPFAVKAKSLSNTGLREGKVDSDPREDEAFVRYAGAAIAITPGYRCINPGETIDFVAEVVGVEAPYNVIWKKVEGYGSINQSGRYQSLSQGTSEAIISAEVENHPELIDYANVRVGGCNCSFLIDIVGGTSFHGEGGDVAYLFSDFGGGFRNYQFFYQLEDLEGGKFEGSFSMNIFSSDNQSAPLPGQTGQYNISAAFTGAAGGSWFTESETSATVNITEHTSTYMVGTVSGTLINGNEQSVSLSGNFKAGNWVGGWPCGQ
jgi:hypothetical protein